jgi:hypothetical protein
MGKGSHSDLSLNLYAIVIDENRREDGTGEEKRGAVIYLLPIHMPRQKVGHRKGVTH